MKKELEKIKEELKKDPTATIGHMVVLDLLNDNHRNRDLLDEINKTSIEKLNQQEQVDLKKREENYSRWFEEGAELIDIQLLPEYIDQLKNYILRGVDRGDSWDLALKILRHLKNDKDMESAKQLLDAKANEMGMDRFFYQNFAFTFSNKGVDFVLETLNREATLEELKLFESKREEVGKRNQSQSIKR